MSNWHSVILLLIKLIIYFFNVVFNFLAQIKNIDKCTFPNVMNKYNMTQLKNKHLKV